MAHMNQVGGMKSSESNQLYETSFSPSMTAYSEIIYGPKVNNDSQSCKKGLSHTANKKCQFNVKIMLINVI